MVSELLTSDLENRQIALNAHHSFIVQAPAGSGKTELLIQRYLTLLNYVDTPEEILAITFTKKAANEMRVRIAKALQDADNNTPIISEHQKTTRKIAKAALLKNIEHKWFLLENPNRLRIQTIDALCATLTRQLPIVSQLGASSTISDTPDLIYLETVKEVLTYLEGNNDWSLPLKILLIHLDNDVLRLYDLLINLLKKRDQWLNYIHLDLKSANIRSFLENELLKVVLEFISQAKSIFPNNLKNELNSIVIYAESHLDNKFDRLNEINYWMDIANLLLTGEGDWRKQVNKNNGFPPPSYFTTSEDKQIAESYKKRFIALLDELKNAEGLLQALQEVSKLPPTFYDDNQWQVLDALFDVLKLCAGQLKVTFKKTGQIDFIENTEAALLSLGSEENPTDLALALDYQIKHILLDEFQDTSYTQFKLLEKLTQGMQADDGRTLFIVGDPMQSIYRFREAEVSLFLSLYERGFQQINLTPIALRKNFRATPELVSWCNKEFQTIFPKSNQMATGAVSYTNSIPGLEKNIASTISMTEIVNGTDSFQAAKIIELINTQLRNTENHKIAILVRARPHLKEIIPLLNKHGIPYQAVDIDPLISKQYIQDILSLTTALLYPADRVAWLSILRAPWCGLTLADLSIIAEDANAPIFARVNKNDVLQKLSTDGRERLNRIIPVLQKSINERYRHHLRFWIENAWRQLGGPACLQHQSQIQDIDCLFKLFEDLNSTSEPFNLDKLKMKMASLFAKPTGETDALQLMTIHSAKGLEFDTVILPHLEKQPANDKSELLHWMEYPLKSNKKALIMAPIHATADDKNPIYQFITRLQKKRTDNEVNRLLYVAATRAKQHLYLFFNSKEESDSTRRNLPSTFLSKFIPSFNSDPSKITKIYAEPLSHTSEGHQERNIQRLTSDFINPYHTSQPIQLGEKKRPGFKLRDLSQKHIGTVTHLLLQMFCENGVHNWKAKSNAQQMLFIKQHLQRLNFSMHELEIGIQTILRIIENTLSDPKGQWIIKPHIDAKAEYAISLLEDGMVEKLVIDRTFIDENGTRWIIDYKTAALDQDDLLDFLKKEEEKYREKMVRYAKAFQLLDQTSIKIGLYFPAIPTWRELTF